MLNATWTEANPNVLHAADFALWLSRHQGWEEVGRACEAGDCPIYWWLRESGYEVRGVNHDQARVRQGGEWRWLRLDPVLSAWLTSIDHTLRVGESITAAQALRMLAEVRAATTERAASPVAAAA